MPRTLKTILGLFYFLSFADLCSAYEKYYFDARPDGTFQSVDIRFGDVEKIIRLACVFAGIPVEINIKKTRPVSMIREDVTPQEVLSSIITSLDLSAEEVDGKLVITQD